MMYQKIASHPTVREIWARTLVERGADRRDGARRALHAKYMDQLQAALDTLQPEQDFVEPQPEAPPPGAAAKAHTARAARARCSEPQRVAARTARRLRRSIKKLERAREKRGAGPGAAGRAHDRLGDRRGARVRVDSRRRHQHPADRRGRRARHVQPSPRGVARRQDRRRPRAAADAAAGARGVRDPQQPAVRERRARLRVRLQRAGAVAPGDLGSAVRRLHQRRAGDPRRVHRLGAREVGAAARRWSCCCRTRTRARAPITRARGPSASCSSPPTSTCGSPTARRRRSTSTCSGARRRCC